ncbi:hypothetical protein OOK44_35965 [Streptomyces cellulosae]|uniref:DUF4244 domain-containing protein n=1 Tax=Streptomyces althioticus TaxID=83380 RepID=A0ABZ1YJ65_9ACTN|nr:hypothetical protein [Streptomyces sp.]MCX4481774.1 hypothetical protein [Streptomyces cellulosae]WTB93399.1 hypothetical protein OIE99_34715 [Streptomyces cellulosae]WTC60790.1 hypothetical protein OH715_36465 [Streptomyces cellulosae]
MSNLSLRLAVAAYTEAERLISAAARNIAEARTSDDRGDNNISMIMWIVGIVAFAAIAIAAFKTLGESKLDDMTGL